jgi:hypothetical protein
MSIKKTDKKYIDLTKQRLASASRLNTYNIFRITETNQYFLNHFRSFEMVTAVKNNDAYFDPYTAIEDDWWDNISFQYYGTSYYWYIICIINDIVNPYEELIPGMKIKLLKNSYLYEILKGIKDISKL